MLTLFYFEFEQAFDHGNPAKSSSVQVMVTVTDQNDNEPLFTDNTMSCDVTENQPPRTVSDYSCLFVCM